ncbi:MAG TPA: hypothetical protein VJR92_03035 [Gemmatimonadaceae bacterium]|nr:hypothetical protein [Gemmatimonadaceae bacterium]
MNANIGSSSSSQNGPDSAQFQGGLARQAADPDSPSWRAAWLLRQAESKRSALRDSERARFRYAVKVVCVCWLGAIAGLVPMGWALHTTNEELGRFAFLAGQVGGSSIILVTLVVAWMRWERDDW